MKVAWLRPALTDEEHDFLLEMLSAPITVHAAPPLPPSVEARTPSAASLPATEEMLACVRDADVIVGSRFTAEILSAAARATVVIVPFAGPSDAELALLRQYGQWTVCNSHYNAPFVAEHAMALLLAAAKQLLPYDRALRQGHWRPERGAPASMTLAGKTMTVLGYGAIGSRIVAMARGFGMRINVIRKNVGSREPREAAFVGSVDDLARILPETDCLMVCVPLTDETRGLLGARHWRLMKRSALVVNVSRGEVLEEGALFRALERGEIAGAGIDAWYRYPAGDAAAQHPAALPFHTLENVVMSPHRAGDTDERTRAQIADVAQQLNRIAAGEEPSNVLWRASSEGATPRAGWD